jgi:hypothetical protein
MSPFCIVVTVDIIMKSDPAKQAAQVVKHHVFDERTVIT